MRSLIQTTQTLKFSVLLCVIAFVLPQQATAQTLSFNRDIRPILSDKCFQCHGPDEETREANLRFDQKQSAFADLGGYFAITAGDVDASQMITRVHEDDPDLRMPPAESGKELTKKEIVLLEQWIKQGAKWSEFWAYVPPQDHPTPKIKNKRWAKNWIDYFTLAKMESAKVNPSKRTDKTTLLRRLYFDLTGLPPTPRHTREFLRTESPEAYEELVDTLLKSKHFGERMASYWLDLVRFADTVGYHGDQDHNISPYRDWVINSLNANMPFDQFTREQLAGDLLPNSTVDQKIASGYNRLLQTTHEGGLQLKEYRAIYAADRVRNVSAVWMGATVGCAQCHDHKFDPYTAKDFYSMAAFFADIEEELHLQNTGNAPNAVPTRREPEMLLIDDANREKLDDASTALNTANQQLRELKTGNVEAPEYKQAIAFQKAKVEQLKKRKKEIEAKGRWTLFTRALAKPRVTRILPRGNWLDESGEIVLPAIPEFMGQLATKSKRANRLGLANWLTDCESGNGKFTARVFANRLWYLMLGSGISDSLDDFGGQGRPPTNPELLDRLALEFSGDWDIKKLIRTIVLSETYRQSSSASAELRSKDPFNQLFARQSKHRLPAEMIRDNALAISGLLNLSNIGGKSVKPYQPAGYYQHLNFPPRKYKHDKSRLQYRRGVYVHWQRQFLHPSLRAFDATRREECTAARPRSNTPLAALALLNDPSYVEAARVFAERILKNGGDTFEAQLDYAFLLAVSRSPEASESATLKQLFVASKETFAENPEDAKKLLSVGLEEANYTDHVELAAWTQVARAILNFDETITRN